MNGYVNAPATKLLASFCVCCGRPLVDSISVEMGIGPECRCHNDAGIDADIQKIANEHVFRAAVACQEGKIDEVLSYAGLIRQLGLTTLADKVERRFKKFKNPEDAVRKVDITITVEGDMLKVKTPFRRGSKAEFIQAWRKIRGRQFKSGANLVPVTEKTALFELLKEFFGGKFGKGPKGIFRIPLPEPKAQMEMTLKVA